MAVGTAPAARTRTTSGTGLGRGTITGSSGCGRRNAYDIRCSVSAGRVMTLVFRMMTMMVTLAGRMLAIGVTVAGRLLALAGRVKLAGGMMRPRMTLWASRNTRGKGGPYPSWRTLVMQTSTPSLMAHSRPR